MTDARSMLKCRLCEWQTPAWTTTKKGKRVSGYMRLVAHFKYAHPEEAAKIERQVEAMCSEGGEP